MQIQTTGKTYRDISYFRAHLDRTIELELEYLPYLYSKIAAQWAIASEDNVIAMAFQRREHIDAVLVTAGGKYKYVEHKFDFYKPDVERRNAGKRNVLIETVMNVYNNTPGWIYNTKADYILFAFERPATEHCLEVYLVSYSSLRAWFEVHQQEYKLHTNYNKPSPTTFRIVPIEHIEQAMKVRSYRIHQDGRVETMEASTLLPAHASMYASQSVQTS